jgi:DNA/RNA endonuclease G (NUC1)
VEQTAALADYGDLDPKWDLGHLTPVEVARDPAGRAEASTLANVVPQAKKLNQ